jgi:hypothetical protein
MPLKKIKSHRMKDVCLHPEHNPPSHIVLEPGDYIYSCPECGKEKVLSVPLITCSMRQTEHAV